MIWALAICVVVLTIAIVAVDNATKDLREKMSHVAEAQQGYLEALQREMTLLAETLESPSGMGETPRLSRNLYAAGRRSTEKPSASIRLARRRASFPGSRRSR